MNYSVDDFARGIGLDDALRRSALDYIARREDKICRLAAKCKGTDFELLRAQSDLTRLAVALVLLGEVYEKYLLCGIDEKVFFDTFSDISIWCENNNNRGLKNIFWIKNHLNFELFRLGRLQFQLFVCNNPTLNYSLLPFERGDKLIYVHIPQGEKLICEDCMASLKSAKAFFAEYFPDYDYKYFFSESWLLYGGNVDFMASGSNIIKFAELFNIAYSVADDRQAIERIFGKRQLFTFRYEENTALQKSAKRYMQSGGKPGVGIGYIDKNTV